MTDCPQSEKAPSETDLAKKGGPLWSLALSAKAYAWALTVAGFYLCGFLVLSAHLAKFVLSDMEFITARYLLAAANYAFFVMCFYFFAGSAVVLMPTWLSEDLKFTNQQRNSFLWSLICTVS